MKKSTKFIKSVTLIFLAVMLAFSSNPLTASAEELTTGSCGDDATYSFDRATGTLTISGTGNTANYTSSNTSPFYNNESVKTAIVEEGISSLGTQLFFGCSNLVSVQLPESLSAIGAAAFINTALNEIAIPKNVDSIGEYAIPGENMGKIIVDEQNGYYTAVDNVLFNKDMTELMVYCAEKADTAYTVPDSVTKINAFAFSDAKNITDVILPVGLKAIGASAFAASMISCITIPSTVTDISTQAFFNCDNLNGIIFMTDNCVITDHQDTIYNSGSLSITPTVYAASGSTAQEYANNYGLNFLPLCVDNTIDHIFEFTNQWSVCYDTTNSYTCSKCNYMYQDVTHDSSHYWDYDCCDYETIEGTDCHYQRCQICGYCDYNERIGCSVSRTEVTRDPTCTEEGELVFFCDLCKGSYTQSIDKNPHEYTKSIVSPTCSKQGYTRYVCQSCGNSYKDNYTEVAGLNFNDNEPVCLNGCGEKNPNYMAVINEDVYTGAKETAYDDFRIIPGYGQIKVAWTADRKIDGYEIYISTDNSNFKKLADVKTESADYYIIDYLFSGQMYYVKIKGYLHYKGIRIEMNRFSNTQSLTVK